MNYNLLHFMYYSFGRIRQTLRVMPAMEAGLADHVWEIKEIVAMLDNLINKENLP